MTSTGSPAPAGTFSELLRARTQTDHDRAERSGFMAALLDGALSRERYAELVAQLSFVYANDDVRYLRAQVRSRRGAADTMSVIGHELQHALEVAVHPSVRDEKAFAALYVRIGDRTELHRFDTAAAREAGVRVRRELN